MKQHSRQIYPQALQDLQQLAPRRSSAPVVWRARIVWAFFAAAGYRQISPRFRCSQATIARWVKRFGYSWERAKRTITSPDPHYQAKKKP